MKPSPRLRRVPFGKYEGFRVFELPDDYLEWLIYDSQIDGPIYEAAMEEFEARLMAEREGKIARGEAV